MKPGNVLVDAADHCYLSDFGLSTQLAAGGTTASGRLAGSLDYLAPEQIRRGEVDGRTDQYALACVLHELLSGAPPFRRETEAQTLWAHMQEEPPSARRVPRARPGARTRAREGAGRAVRELRRVRRRRAVGARARPVARRDPSPPTPPRRATALRGRALLVLAVAAAALALTLGSDGQLAASPNSIGVVDPASLELTQALPVGNTPTEVAASDEWVWVLNSNDGAGTISRIDAQTRTVASTFSVGGTPRNLVAAFGSLWVGTVEGRVLRVDPATDLVDTSWTLRNAGEGTAFDVDQGPGWLAVGPNVIWAASSRTISRIDPVTSEVRALDSTAWGPMAYGFGSLWVLARGVERLSAATMRRVATVELPAGYVDVATGFASVWVADDDSGTVIRVDARRNVIERTYELGGSAFGVAVGAGAVWAASDDGTVARIDPETDDVALVEVGGAPRALDVDGGPVWVSVD